MGPPASTPDRAGDGLTVFYNGACPVCRREIDHYRRYAGARNLPLHWTDVTDAPGVLAARGIDPETQRRRLHVLTPDGEIVAGVDALALAWRRMPRFRWLGALLRGRAMRAAAHVAYDRFVAAALYRWDRHRRRREGGGDLPHDHPT